MDKENLAKENLSKQRLADIQLGFMLATSAGMYVGQMLKRGKIFYFVSDEDGHDFGKAADERKAVTQSWILLINKLSGKL